MIDLSLEKNVKTTKKLSGYLAIIGPTASGKSDLALKLASELDGEIVSCDSVQIYKGFDIGSAKPTADERARIPHHLLDLMEWSESFDANQYRLAARKVIADIESRGKQAIVVGGTGLYFRALWGYEFHDLPHDEILKQELSKLSQDELYDKLKQLDPERSAVLHKHDKFRLVRACEVAILTGGSVSDYIKNQDLSLCPPAFIIKCLPSKSQLHENIVKRTQQMLDQGLIAETKKLLSQGCPFDAKPMQSIGYRQVCDYLSSEISPAARSSVVNEELSAKIITATRQYAKRQYTWFQKIEPNLTCAQYPIDFKEIFNSIFSD